MMQAEDSRQIPQSSHSPKDETKGLSDQGKVVETVKNDGTLAVPLQSGQARPSPGNQSQVLSAKVKTNEDFNAKTEMEKSRFENIVMSELAELNIIDLPTVKQLQIDNSAEFDMQTKTKVKGFCGTSVKTHPYLAKFDTKAGELIKVPADKSGKQTKQTGEVIDFPFENFIADSFKHLVDKQRTAIGKKELKENPQNTLDTKASNYTYIMALSQPGIKHPETQFIYFKNDAELITFKNTLIQSSTIGKSFIRQQSSDDGVIRQALSRNKSARAEAVFSAIEKTINEKRRLRERETKLVSQTPKQVAPVSPPKIELPLAKKQLNYKAAISFIRKLAIFQSVTNEQIIAMEEGFKEEENARYHKVQTFFKNYALKKARFERKKLVQCMKTKTVIKSSALFPQTQTDNTDYGILYPRMYFDIHFTSTGELQKISNSSLRVFKLFILLTNEIYSSENVLYFSSDELDLASIPGYSVLRQSEFKVVDWKNHGISLLNSDFKYLLVYKVNSESHNVEAIGYEEIPKKTTLAFEVSLKPCSYASDSQGTSGKLVFSNNHHIVTPEEVESKVSSSLSVKNFKYLSKLYSEKESDTSLSRTVGIYGLKSHFSTFRDSILRKYAFERYLSEKSSVIHDLIEWNIFERTVDKSIREYNRSLINDMAQSHHTLPLNSDAMVDKGTIIYSSFQYEQLALSLNLPKSQQRGNTSPELSSSSNDFIYFGRYQWHKCRDLHVEKDSTLKAMVTGVPTWMCLNVWKSLGKIELLRALVSQSINNASGSPGASKPAYQYLLEKGKDVDLTNYQDCKKEIEDLKYMSNRSTSVVQRTTGLVRAYLALAEVLDEYTPESSIEQVSSSPSEIYRMPLLSGLTLRTFSKIVQIIERLAFYYEEYLANYDNYKKELDKNGHSNLLNHSRVIEEDLFYILIAISIVFLPEHFLIPLPNSTSNKPVQLAALERLGLDLDNVFQNRMFISSSAIGDYKLAVLFAECVRKTNSSVFNKMANLGFPFTSFCFEATETLFCNLFNDGMLCKIWQLIFFEGSSNIKRRAQQAMLSILVALVNLCGSLILEAQSGDEILWQLTAVAQQLYDRTEFMSEVIKIRKQLFIHNDLEVVAWIEDIVNLDPRLEVQLQTIKTAMHDQLNGVANSNYCYLKYLTSFSSGLKDDKKAESLQKSAMSLYSIFNSFEVVSDIKGQNTVQSLILQMADMEYVLKEKPQANKLLVTVANFLEGNYIPNSSHFTITSTVNNDQIKIGLGPRDSSIGKMYTLESLLPSVNLRDHFLEIQLESLNREGKRESHTKQIHLDILRFNQESYFEFNLGTARLDICIMMENADVKIPSEMMLNDFLEDIQQRVKIFPEDLADQLKIASKVPYSVDLSYNQIPHDQQKKQSMLCTILGHMFPIANNKKQQSVWLNNYIKELNQADLLKQSMLSLIQTELACSKAWYE